MKTDTALKIIDAGKLLFGCALAGAGVILLILALADVACQPVEILVSQWGER